MGKKAHCPSTDLLEIQQLKSGKSYQEISRQIRLSVGMKHHVSLEKV